MMARMGGIVTVVDVGTYSIKAALGERVSDGFKMLGYSSLKTNGFSNQGIVDAVGLRASVNEAIGELQSQMIKKAPLGDLVLTISSDIFEIENRRVEKTISTEKGEPVKEGHIRDIFLSLLKEEDIVDVIPLRYKLDDGRKVINPVSMSTSKLLAELLVVKISEKTRKELESIVNGYNFSALSIAHPGILAAEGVLNENEKERGILCVEIGYTTTKVSAYANGKPVAFHFIPLGVSNVVKDVAQVFKVSYNEAERLIFYHCDMDYESIEESETVETTDFDNKTKKEIKKRSLSLAAYARVREILSMSRRSMAKLLGTPIFSPVGVVITGGGASIPGVSKVGASVFNMTCRIGTYASSNNVVVSGAEEIVATPGYSLLFGALVHRYKYDFVEGKPLKGSFSQTTLNATQGDSEAEEPQSFLKKIWEFLKKLV